jgi:tetratricopeptide (TPR) repeat protein
MSVAPLSRIGFPSLILILTAGSAFADALQDCRNASLPPDAQRSACDAAIEAAADPLERARLHVLRAGTWAREPDRSGADEALPDLAEAERLAPEADPQLRADLLVLRAGAHYAQGNLEAGQAETEEAARLAPNDADPVISRGILLADQGDLDGALAQFAQALELEPDHVEARVVSMYYLYEAQEFDTCVETGNTAVELAPADARVWAARGLCLTKLGRAEDALADLKEAERLGLYTMTTHLDIVTVYRTLDRPEEALATARRVMEFDPKDERSWTALMATLVDTGAVDEAMATYREAQAAGVEGTPGLMANRLAWALYQEDHYEEALPIIEEGLAQQAEPHPYHLDTYAHILTALGRTDEAVQTDGARV